MNKISLKSLLTLAVAGAAAGGSLLSLTACPGNNGKDYTKDIKLTLDYTNRNFFTDGIGEVKLFTHIDGDTSHFKCVYGDTTTTLKSRYYGIDTPESTGAIQQCGQEASNYTHHRLEEANEHGTIVVSSPFNYYGAPEADSTGSRYLSLVWINETKQHAPISELSLLNLYIVQDGWSWAKNLADIPEYVDTFQAAQKQAEKLKRGMWSDNIDEICPIDKGEKTTDVLRLKNEVTNYLEAKNKGEEYVNQLNGQNVRFTGVVSGFCNNTLYVQEEVLIDPNDESLGTAWGGINIFTGMTAISSKFTEVGTYLEIHGTAKDSETFGFQVTNTQGHWPVSTPKEGDCKVLLTAEQNNGEHALKTFELSAAEQNSKLQKMDLENLYCRTHITDPLVCNKFYINDAGDEVTLNFEGANFSVYLPFQYDGLKEEGKADVWNTAEKFLGKHFDIKGVLSYHESLKGNISYQIVPCGSDDLTCLEDKYGTTSFAPYTVSDAVAKAETYQSESAINYYTKAKIASVSGTSMVITDGAKSMNVAKFELDKSVDTANLKAGATVSLFGTVSEGKYVNATIYGLNPYGTTSDDPLKVEEANEMALALADGATSDVIYYFKGEVSEIVTAYDSSTKRITVKLGTGEKTMVVSPKMGSGINVEDIIVGATIVVRGKLTNKGGVASTVDNGTQVVEIIK